MTLNKTPSSSGKVGEDHKWVSTATVAAVDNTPLRRIAGNTERRYFVGDGARIKSTKHMTAVNRMISDLAIIPAAINKPTPSCVLLVCDFGVMPGMSVASN